MEVNFILFKAGLFSACTCSTLPNYKENTSQTQLLKLTTAAQASLAQLFPLHQISLPLQMFNYRPKFSERFSSVFALLNHLDVTQMWFPYCACVSTEEQTWMNTHHMHIFS